MTDTKAAIALPSRPIEKALQHVDTFRKPFFGRLPSGRSCHTHCHHLSVVLCSSENGRQGRPEREQEHSTATTKVTAGSPNETSFGYVDDKHVFLPDELLLLIFLTCSTLRYAREKDDLV